MCAPFADTRTESMRPSGPESSIRVLVAGADLSRIYFIRMVVALMGFRHVECITIARDAVDVVERAAAGADVVLLDDSPPTADGLDIALHLRGHATTADIPLIVITGQPRDNLWQQAMIGLCVVVLPQPCSVHELRTAMLSGRPRCAAPTSVVSADL